MKNLDIDSKALAKEIADKVKKITEKEILDSPDSCPIGFSILEMLEVYEKGDFYGVFTIRTLGNSARNLKIQEQSLKLVEKNYRFILDN